MKKSLIVFALVVIAAVLALAGCASAPRTQSVAPDAPRPGIPAPASGPPSFGITAPSKGLGTINVPAPAPAPRQPAAVGQDTTASLSADRMIVRTGNIAVVVEDVPVAIDRIAKLAQSMEGYVVASSVFEEGSPSPVIVTPGFRGEVPDLREFKRFSGVISIRVPAQRFDEAILALRGMAVKVTSENSTSKDVTEEYVDLKAKLGNLEAAEVQLLKILEKADKVEDILNVQRELSRVRGEIEQTKGRIQFLERTTSTSLIEVSLQQAKLDVSFTATKTKVKKGEDISFVPQIAGGVAPFSYEWNFGDGRTSTDRNPSHTYNKAGDYTVTLKVTDDRNSTDTETRTAYISVAPGWNPGNVASGAWDALVVFVQVLGNIFIVLGTWSPVWIIGGGIAWLVIFIRRKKARK